MKRHLLLSLIALLLLPLTVGAAKQPAKYKVKMYSPELVKAAESGDAEAQAVLGEVLMYGKGCATNRDQAITWLQKSADQGNPIGIFNLAVCYQNGWGTASNEVKARQLATDNIKELKKLADNGNGLAMTAMGLSYFKGLGNQQKNSDAFKWFKKAAQADDVHGMYMTGLMMQQGKGTTKDPENANIWLLKAAEAGDNEAIMTMANNFYKGIGTPQNDVQAFTLFKKAAEFGFPEAFFYCGECYEYGNGTEKNRDLAYQYYTEGANRGDVECRNKIAFAYAKGIAPYPKNREEAKKIYASNAQQGDAFAMEALGDMYYEEQNLVDALQMYNQAYAKRAKSSVYNKIVAIQNIAKWVETYAKKYAFAKDLFEGRYPDDQYFLYGCNNDPEDFEGIVKKNGTLGYNVQMYIEPHVVGEAYMDGSNAKGYSTHPNALLKCAITKSGITFTLNEDCQIECSFHERTGQPKAPADPYREAYGCKAGSTTGTIGFVLQDGILCKTGNEDQPIIKRVAATNGTRTCTHSNFKFSGMGPFAPYKFKHSSTFKINFDDIARKNGISKDEVVLGIMTGVIGLLLPGMSDGMDLECDVDLAIFYALAKTFNISEKEWVEYLTKVSSLPRERLD